MTDIRTLLHTAAAAPATPVSVPALVERAARRRRLRRAGLWVIGGLSAVGLVPAGLSLAPGDRGGEQQVQTRKPPPTVPDADDETPGVQPAVTVPGRPRVTVPGAASAKPEVRSVTGTVPPVTERPIVFVRDYSLWAMSADGSDAALLYDPPGLVTDPEWSPEGTRIAFAVDDALWVLQVQGPGAGKARSLGPGREPTWSAEGTQLAFAASDAAGNSDVWVMAADGSARRRLTLSPQWEGEPAWSPDGKAIAYVNAGAEVSNGVGSVGAPSPSTLHLVGPSGSGDRVVATDVREPAWSADGSQLAFSFVSTPGVGVARADGSGVRRLTDGAGGRDQAPSWSRDGTLVFERDPDRQGGVSDTHNSSLFVIRADGTGLRRLTDGGADDAAPDARRA